MRLILSALALISSAAMADETFRRTVPAGKETGLLRLGGAYNNTCEASPMPVVSGQPQHGKIDLRPASLVMNDPNSTCKGKTIPAKTLFYLPEPGYRGADQVVMRLDWDDGRISHRVLYTIEIEVK